MRIVGGGRGFERHHVLDRGLARFHWALPERRLRKKSGMSRTPAPLPIGRQSDGVASPARGGRLSGDPIGCGVSLSRLMRAASLGLTASNGMAIRAKLSAWRLASSRADHDRIGIVRGYVKRCRPALLSS